MDGRIIILKERILKNLKKDWTIAEMSDSINLSESHLQKLFNKETGEPPAQFVKYLRLEKARELLEDREFFLVKEIRAKVGIEGASHFTRDFKERYGLSPSEYRATYWQKYEIANSEDNK